MVNHEKIRGIQADLYNNFYLKIKNMRQEEESWKTIINLGTKFADKYKNERVAEILVMAYEDIIEAEWENGSSQKQIKP